MNITESTGTWQLRPREVTNLKTNSTRRVYGMPAGIARDVAIMSQSDFIRDCAIAFEAGVWPKVKLD